MMPIRTYSFLLILSALWLPANAAAQDLAYVEATTELDNGRPATYAYNLVDGKPTTAWCSQANPGPHTLVYGFKRPVTVDHLAVVVGALKGSKLNTTRARVATLMLSDGQTRREVTFDDVAEVQEVKLDPPMQGRRLVIDVKAIKPGASSTAPVCMGELHLNKGRKGLSDPGVYKALRRLNTPARRLLHNWVDEPSAPERTLVFSLDGTFTYVFEPLLDGEPVSLRGTWRAVGKNKVIFEVKGKKTSMKSRITRIDDGNRQTQELRLSGNGPDVSLNTSFKAAPIRYE